MRRTLIKNGKLVLPDKIINESNLLFEDDKILEIGYKGQLPENTELIDAKGGFISPGLVDMHLHGGGGYDFMDGTKEALINISRNHCMHGTTSLAPTTVACSNEELFSFFDIYRKVTEQCDIGTKLLGIHMEGPYISQEMKGAQPAQYVRNVEEHDLNDILDRGADIIIRWSVAPELPGMQKFAEKISKYSILPAIAHSNATCDDILRSFKWGYRHITHLYSNTPSVRKISQNVHAGVVEAAYLIDEMTVELIGDGKHVPPELMQMVYKIKGVEQLVLITDSMRAAGTDVSESFLGSHGSGNPVIIEDGVAKLPDRTYFAGSIATADKVIQNAHFNVGLPLYDAIRMMSLTPCKILGLEKTKGSLEKGKDADIVIFDEKLNVGSVFVEGKLKYSRQRHLKLATANL